MNINIKTPNAFEIKLRLGKAYKQADIILARAINRAVITAKAQVAKEVTPEYFIKSSDVKASLKTKKATRSNLLGEVKSTGHKVPLRMFRISPKSRPEKQPKAYKARVKKSSKLKAVIGAFVTTLKYGENIFERTGKKRGPVKQLYGPSIPQMIGNESVIDKIEKKASETLQKRIDHEIKRVLG